MNELARQLAAGGATLAYAGLCAALYLRERRRAAAQAGAAAALNDRGGPPVLVAHATQTGQAEALAWQTAKALHAAGLPVRVLPLNAVDAALLARTPRALFIASTYGEGDAPDGASDFFDTCMARPAALAPLRYGLLALGDRQYARFCGFGRQLDDWLRASGATPDFAPIEVDRGDPEALAQWQRRLGVDAAAPAAAATPQPWTLARREHLNPGSQGGPIHLVTLRPPAGPPLVWEAGDVADVHLAEDPGRPRSYSICSIPEEGELRLLVRQVRHADGRPGAASGLLGTLLQPGQQVDLALRPNPGFRLGDNARRPLVLIGNGTGLAGLRALLRARIARGLHDQWLVFGERQAAHDALLDDELRTWLAEGRLARLDRVFSRDQPTRRYVQHVLLEQAQALRSWYGRGAAFYVCGSLEGMAAEVDAALRQVLGAAGVQALRREGRYLRDVY